MNRKRTFATAKSIFSIRRILKPPKIKTDGGGGKLSLVVVIFIFYGYGYGYGSLSIYASFAIRFAMAKYSFAIANPRFAIILP